MNRNLKATMGSELLQLSNTATASMTTSASTELQYVLAISFALLASFSAALGDNLIRLSYTKEAKEKLAHDISHASTPLFFRPLWFFGVFCLAILNTVFSLLSYSLADASAVLPFVGTKILFNIFLAKRLNREECNWRHLLYTGLVLVGVTIVLIGGHAKTSSKTEYSLAEIKGLFHGTDFVFLSIATLFIGIALLSLWAGTDVLTERNKMVFSRSSFSCLSVSVISGVFASVTQLFSKIVAELLFSDGVHQTEGDLDADPDSKEAFWWLALFVLGALCFGGLHLASLNYALRKHSVYVVSPFITATLVVYGSFYVSIFFEEWKTFNDTQKSLLPVGIICTALGVVLLAFAQPGEEGSSSSGRHGVKHVPMSVIEPEKPTNSDYQSLNNCVAVES